MQKYILKVNMQSPYILLIIFDHKNNIASLSIIRAHKNNLTSLPIINNVIT